MAESVMNREGRKRKSFSFIGGDQTSDFLDSLNRIEPRLNEMVRVHREDRRCSSLRLSTPHPLMRFFLLSRGRAVTHPIPLH